MLEYFKNKIYFHETLKNKYKSIIELFVLYYGEEFRELITKKINNTTMVCYYPNDGLLSDLDTINSNKVKELSLNLFNFIDKLGYEIDKKTKDIFAWYHFSRYIRGDAPLNYIENYLYSKTYDDNKKTKAFMYLKSFDNSINLSNIDEKKINGEFDYLKNIIIPKYKEIIQEWLNYQQQYFWVINMAKSENKLKDEIFFKNWKAFVLEKCSNFLPEDEVKIIKENEIIDKNQIPTTCFYVGYLFDNYDLDFKTEILTKDFMAFSYMQKEVINVLNNLGFELGDDINTYLQNEEVNKTINIIRQLLSIKEDYERTAEYEFAENSIMASKIINQIKEKNILYTDPIDEAIYLLIRKGVTGSLLFDVSKDSLDINPILSIDLSDKANMIDKTLMHELNHRLEMGIIEKNDETYDYICGWQKGKKSSKESSLDSKYMWINEVINEMISIDIYNLMEKNNVSIFGKRNVDKQFDRGIQVSSYDKGKVLLKEFFDDNLKSIISSRLNGDINILYEEIGKENFEELNALVNYFFEEFEGINYTILSEDLNLNKETNLTLKYRKMLEKKDIILDNIKNYKNKKATR